MMTLQHCLREASLAEEIAAQISLDTHRARMVQIAQLWRAQAESLRRGDPRLQADPSAPNARAA